MTLQTRKPTGKVAWPIILLAGGEGSGKTWAAAEASGIEYIDRAFFLEAGEASADEYGAIPGADYEVIEHDGSFQAMLEAVKAAGEVPAAEGKANMLIIDSISEIWELLTDMAQHQANGRRGRAGANGEKQITMDLWNSAKGAMSKFIVALRRFPGVVIITSRLDYVAEVEGGKPTGVHVWKVRAEKNLPYQAQVVVQARKPRTWTLTKIMSTKFQLDPGGEMPLPDFSVEKILDAMGVTPGAAASSYVEPDREHLLDPEDGTPQQQQQRPQRQQQAPQQQQRPPVQDLPPLPADPQAVITQLEQHRNVGTLQELWKVANAHGRMDIRQAAEDAGKRVAAAVKAAEANAARQAAKAPAADPVDEAAGRIQEAQEKAEGREPADPEQAFQGV